MQALVPARRCSDRFHQGNFQFLLHGVFHHEVRWLSAGPNANSACRVDDQAAGAPDLVHELPELCIRIAVETHLVAKRLGVKPPAFDKRRVTAVASEVGDVLFHCERDLQVMSGHALMERQGHHFIFRSNLRLESVYTEYAGTGAIGRGSAVKSGGTIGRDICRHRLDAVGRVGKPYKDFHQQRVYAPAGARGRLQVLRSQF